MYYLIVRQFAGLCSKLGSMRIVAYLRPAASRIKSRVEQASRYAHAATINSRRKISNCFSGALDSSMLRLIPAIIPGTHSS